MDALPIVRNLSEVLKNCLKIDEQIISNEVSRLTAPGENYGSIMLRILVTIKDEKTGKTRLLDTVAKMVPNNEKIRQIFNSQVTYRNEYKFYTLIVPTLDKFLKGKGIETGMDFIAPFFGGRLNLNTSGHIDDDAMIVLKNLKSEGYTTGNKSQGLDIEASKVVLDLLAKFHATGLALKLEKSFDEFRAYFYTFAPDIHLSQMTLNNLIESLQDNGFSDEEIESAKKTFQRDPLKIKNISDQWGTIIHTDTWTCNVLLKYEDSKPVHGVLVDFQIYDYGSPLNDVMFFLCSSVRQDIFETHLDSLLDYYYEKIVDNLDKMGVDNRTFTRSSFDVEIASAMKNHEYFHVMWMLMPLMCEDFKSVDDIDSKDVVLNWTKEHIQKVTFITRICLQRDWL